MRPKAIVIGGIGTLVETSELQRAAFNRAFEEAGLDWHWERDVYRSLLAIAGGRNRIRHFGRHSSGVDEQTIESLHARKTELFQQAVSSAELNLRDGVRDLIDRASGEGVKLGIASTTSQSNLVALAAACGLDLMRFDAVVYREMVTRAKPHPEVYRHCLSLLGVAAQRAVAIEDSNSGVCAARAAGLSCIALPGSNTASDDYGEASTVVSSLLDVDVYAAL